MYACATGWLRICSGCDRISLFYDTSMPAEDRNLGSLRSLIAHTTRPACRNPTQLVVPSDVRHVGLSVSARPSVDRGRPDRTPIACRIISEIGLTGAVSVHHVDLSVPISTGE